MKLKYGPYSPSRLDTAACGYAFYRQYADPQRPKFPESLPQARGSVVHKVFEKITADMCKGLQTSPSEIKDLVVSMIAQHLAAYPEVGEILQMAQGYVQRPPHTLLPDAEIETRMAVKLSADGRMVECGYDDPDALGRGIADIMMISNDLTHALVIDHKTQPNIEEADTFQLGFYAWVISKTHPFLKEIRTILHFARYGIYSAPFIWMTGPEYDHCRAVMRDLEAIRKEALAAPDLPLEERERIQGEYEAALRNHGYSPAHAKCGNLAEIEDEIMTRIAIIEGRTSWEATPHQKCQYCPFISECPLLGDLVVVDENGQAHSKNPLGKILDMPQAVKQAGYLSVLEEITKRIKDNLKNHVEKYGPIAIPGKIYEFKAKEEIDWDRVNKFMKNQLYEIFRGYGIDAKEFMGFSQTFTKSLWMLENEELLKALSSVLPRKASTEFRGYKA